MQPRMAELLFYVGDLEWSQLSGDLWWPSDRGGLCAVHIIVFQHSIIVLVRVSCSSWRCSSYAGLLSGCY